MLTLRKSAERGQANHGWLYSQHTFSFAGYFDPQHMGFQALRVINEDRIAGGSGFDSHPHRDMEIISYVVAGALQHKDSMGTEALIRPGDIQRMSAASGVVHSEQNYLADQETHFFQIWIVPDSLGGEPGYGQKSFAADLQTKNLVLVVSRTGREGSISIRQDVDMYLSRLKPAETIEFPVRPDRCIWLQMVHGEVQVGAQVLRTGDALSTTDERTLTIHARQNSEFMLFDLVSNPRKK